MDDYDRIEHEIERLTTSLDDADLEQIADALKGYTRALKKQRRAITGNEPHRDYFRGIPVEHWFAPRTQAGRALRAALDAYIDARIQVALDARGRSKSDASTGSV